MVEHEDVALGRVEIERGRGLSWMLVACLALALVGLWMLVSPGSGASYQRGLRGVDDPVVVRVLGAAAVLLFGAPLLVALRRLLAPPSVGLVIDRQGFEDRSSLLRVGRVAWSEVGAMELARVAGQPLLGVRCISPETVVQRVPHPVLRWLARVNTKHQGTPVSIAARNLAFTVDELVAHLEAASGMAVRR